MNWVQFRAIVWLRWRLTRNQFARSGPLNTVLSVVLAAMTIMAGIGLGAGGVALGWFAGARAPFAGLLLIWDVAIFVFLVFWFSGLMVEIQRSESVDLARLLHLPVTLRQVFVFNYVASHFTPGIVVIVPGLMGLCVGLIFGVGPLMLLLLPVVAAFIFAVTAWTYCLRGWLAALMMNKRRRRAIIVWIAVGFILASQLPNLVVNSPMFRSRHNTPSSSPSPAAKRNGDRLTIPEIVVDAHSLVPPGWPGYSAMRLREGNALPALMLTTAGLLIGVLGLIRAYLMTIRFYRGEEGPTAASETRVATKAGRGRGQAGRLLVERNLPWLPDDTAALVLATFRSLTRAPEVKMALVMPLLMGVFVAVLRFGRARGAGALSDVLASFAVATVIVASVFMLAPLMSNVFGLDRNGFRGLVLLPAPREKILLAKNLAYFPFLAGVTLLTLMIMQWVLAMPWTTLLVGLVLQIPTAFLLFCPIANLFSILLPFRLAEGTLKAQKPKALVFIAAFGVMLLTPVLLIPILIPPGLHLLFSETYPWLPVHLLAALPVFGGALWLYRSVLPAQGRLLQRRE